MIIEVNCNSQKLPPRVSSIIIVCEIKVTNRIKLNTIVYFLYMQSSRVGRKVQVDGQLSSTQLVIQGSRFLPLWFCFPELPHYGAQTASRTGNNTENHNLLTFHWLIRSHMGNKSYPQVQDNKQILVDSQQSPPQRGSEMNHEGWVECNQEQGNNDMNENK